jgi:hypothetical protein
LYSLIEPSFFYFQTQLEEENVLATQQQETLDANYKKYNMLEDIMQNGDIKNLAHHYKVNLADDGSGP